MQNNYKYRSLIKRQTSGTLSDNEWYHDWQQMEKSDIEWQRVVQWMTTSGTTNGNKWQKVTTRDNEWQRVTANDNEWHQTTASGTTKEKDTVHFNEWMTAIKHKNRYTSSRRR